jgi:N-acyl-D-amino-acid deacylase
VAPGFIDVHSHFDYNLPLADHERSLAPLLVQGVTTLVTGNCGSSPAPVSETSIPILNQRLGAYGAEATGGGAGAYFRWRTFGEYLDALERDGILFNTAFIVGHGAIRYAVMGVAPRKPTPPEQAAMAEMTRQSLREGAFGFSTGLGYEPGMYADGDELLPLLRITAEEGGVYTVHSRAYSIVAPTYPDDVPPPHNVLSTREQLELAGAAGVRLQLSHLLFNGRRTWSTFPTVLRDVEKAVDQGVQIGIDSFPYTFGNTTIHVNLPKWFLAGLEDNIESPAAVKRVEAEIAARNETVGRTYQDITLMHGAAPELSAVEGMNFAEIADFMGLTEFEAYLHVARVSGGRARILQDTYSGDSQSEEPLRAVITHPLCSYMTDTLVFAEGYPNRATYGTFPRFLGHYCRDLGLLTLEETVHKMTGLPAQQIRLEGVGRIAEGNWADVTLFDPETVADNTTPKTPGAAPTGIRKVLISGQVVAQDGELTRVGRRGRVMRR